MLPTLLLGDLDEFQKGVSSAQEEAAVTSSWAGKAVGSLLTAADTGLIITDLEREKRVSSPVLGPDGEIVKVKVDGTPENVQLWRDTETGRFIYVKEPLFVKKQN